MTQLTGKDHSYLFASATAYCTNHQGQGKREGGKTIVSANGKTQRWICAACAEARLAKKSA